MGNLGRRSVFLVGEPGAYFLGAADLAGPLPLPGAVFAWDVDGEPLLPLAGLLDLPSAIS